MVAEDRIGYWVPAGIPRQGEWSVLLTESSLMDVDIEDVRKDDERGRR